MKFKEYLSIVAVLLMILFGIVGCEDKDHNHNLQRENAEENSTTTQTNDWDPYVGHWEGGGLMDYGGVTPPGVWADVLVDVSAKDGVVTIENGYAHPNKTNVFWNTSHVFYYNYDFNWIEFISSTEAYHGDYLYGDFPIYKQ
jgi:hypothetical protein